jgi:hypothetical protein
MDQNNKFLSYESIVFCSALSKWRALGVPHGVVALLCGAKRCPLYGSGVTEGCKYVTLEIINELGENYSARAHDVLPMRDQERASGCDYKRRK